MLSRGFPFTATLLLVACTRADSPPAATASTAAHDDGAPAMVDALLGSGRLTLPLAELPARAALAPTENFKVVELGRDANTSHHVVALRDREPVHRHDTHDLLVITLEGHGSMLIGDEERTLGPRSIVYVPRGVPHSMRNTSGTPLYGYAVFSPPFDGKDRVPVE